MCYYNAQRGQPGPSNTQAVIPFQVPQNQMWSKDNTNYVMKHLYCMDHGMKLMRVAKKAHIQFIFMLICYYSVQGRQPGPCNTSSAKTGATEPNMVARQY
eukprot:scaffold124007_cov86-Attheya_sp.AAC.1